MYVRSKGGSLTTSPSRPTDQFVQRPDDHVLTAFGQDADGGSKPHGGDSGQVERVGEDVLSLDFEVRRQRMIRLRAAGPSDERHDDAADAALQATALDLDDE